MGNNISTLLAEKINHNF